MKFGTVVNCMDGRVPYPGLDYPKEQIRTSIKSHGSKRVVVAGHHDCGDNPADRMARER